MCFIKGSILDWSIAQTYYNRFNIFKHISDNHSALVLVLDTIFITFCLYTFAVSLQYLIRLFPVQTSLNVRKFSIFMTTHNYNHTNKCAQFTNKKSVDE